MQGKSQGRDRDDLSREHPALLDPIDPGDPILLTFRPNGEIDLSPDFRGDARAVAKLDASRLGLHLNWPKFVEGRMALYNLIERTVERGRREAPVDFLGWTMASEAFKDAIRDLRSFMDTRSEYSAAARVYIESFRDVWWVFAPIRFNPTAKDGAVDGTIWKIALRAADFQW